MFRSPYDHPQRVCQALLKLHYVPLTCTLMQVMWEHAYEIQYRTLVMNTVLRLGSWSLTR